MVEEGGGGYRILSFGGLVNLDRKKNFFISIYNK